MRNDFALRSPAALLTAGLVGGLAWARSRRRVSLRGASALIAGGSRGLGLDIARELAARGARLTLCARDAGELAAARLELEGQGAEVLALPCDVTDREAMGELAAAAVERFGRIDVLFNVASIIQVAPAEALSLDDLHAAMDANFWGMVHATAAVLPAMRARRSGRIVNITSIGGTVAVPHLLGYTSAKFAAVGYSTGLAAEVARDGVVVTTIVPGLMRTGSFLHALVKGRRAAEANLFSVAASLPVLTMNARRAARRIVEACERGERFVTLGAPWKLARVVAALAPGFTGWALALGSRLLPDAGGEPAESRPDPAHLHRRGAGRSVLTRLGDEAAAAHNEEPALRH